MPDARRRCNRSATGPHPGRLPADVEPFDLAVTPLGGPRPRCRRTWRTDPRRCACRRCRCPSAPASVGYRLGPVAGRRRRRLAARPSRHRPLDTPAHTPFVPAAIQSGVPGSGTVAFRDSSALWQHRATSQGRRPDRRERPADRRVQRPLDRARHDLVAASSRSWDPRSFRAGPRVLGDSRRRNGARR